jgi:magnesium transporter
MEDGVMLLVIRVPLENEADPRVPYQTLPIGVVITPTAVITVCRSDRDLVTELLNGRTRIVDTAQRMRFAIQLMQRTALMFLRCLKDINRRSDVIEQRLQLSTRNQELIDLLGIEKSLVYFATSLKANDIIMDKVLRMRSIQLSEEEADLLEDAITENRQAIGMANIYSDILSGTMDAFASIISNNMNTVMKFLTGFTIIMMIPNIVSGVYGMNIALPFQHDAHAFSIVTAMSAGACLLAWLVFIKKRWL